ncbi:MAG TPA: hypothetical protein VED17_02560 [Nitrososphaerales archaeon]|nr:hypothetical protein [Nitrososphaerales archaeon]
MALVVISLFTAFTVLTLFPLLSPIPSLPIKPVILYYNYENLPFNTSEFPAIVQKTSEHHFNTLMMLVYYNHREIFNESTLNYFFTYARSKNLTFVPSFYLESLGDNFNSTGFPWINLDMEKIAPNLQRFVYARVSDQSSGLVSITSPYGQPVEFSPSLDILETYSSTPSFWFMQLSYWHTDHICSVASWMLHSQQEYDSEKNYCLKYSQGVMVFDYFNLLKSHLN